MPANKIASISVNPVVDMRLNSGEDVVGNLHRFVHGLSSEIGDDFGVAMEKLVRKAIDALRIQPFLNTHRSPPQYVKEFSDD
jgi:hypothetical protein